MKYKKQYQQFIRYISQKGFKCSITNPEDLETTTVKYLLPTFVSCMTEKNKNFWLRLPTPIMTNKFNYSENEATMLADRLIEHGASIYATYKPGFNTPHILFFHFFRKISDSQPGQYIDKNRTATLEKIVKG